MPSPTTHNHRSRSRRHPYSRSSSRFRRPSPFEFFRIAVYAFALVWSLVALAISAHFQAVLQPSDLTRFIPFALFVSVASFVASIGLISLVVVFNSSPFSVKTEILSSGPIGVFWIILATLASLSPAEDAEVECFSVQDESELIETSFNTDTYHAQYRVLVAASCICALCLLGICAFLSFLAFRHFRRTSNWVTYTREPLLDKSSNEKTHEKTRSTSRKTAAVAPLTALPKKVVPKSAEKTKDKIKGLPLPAVAKGSTSRANPPTKSNPVHVDSSKKKPVAPPVQRTKSTPIASAHTKKVSTNTKPIPDRSKPAGGPAISKSTQRRT